MKRFTATLALALLLAGPLSAIPVTDQNYKWVGEGLICPCGCGSTVYGCNHYGCTESDHLRKEVREAIAASDSQEAALKLIGDKYGAKILAEPPKSGFNLAAWIMPFAVLLGGLLVVSVVLRGWRRRHTAEALTAPALDPALLERYQSSIDEEIEKD